MKKFLSILMVMSLLLLTACGGTDGNGNDRENSGTGTVGEENESGLTIYEELTGLDEDQVVMTVDGNEITAGLYLYWTAYLANLLESDLVMYNTYFDMYGELLNADNTMKWDEELFEGVTVRDYLTTYVREVAIRFACVENLAEVYDITLTEDDLAAIEDYKAEMAASYREQLVSQDEANAELTDEEIIDKNLQQLGITEKLFERITASPYYYNTMKTMATTEGSELYLPEEGYTLYGYYADHILLATMDVSTTTTYDQETIDKQRALAEDILAQLRESSDPVTLFAQLADEYSEDTGRETNPTGYVFGPGEMVEVFEETTASLAVGEISEIVESNYGFHIILRKDLAEGLAAYPEEKDALVELYVEGIITDKMDAAQVVLAPELETLDIAQFYTDYSEYMGKATATDDILDDSTNVGASTQS